MKISKNQLKKLIMEEIGGMPARAGEGNVYPGYGYTKNYPDGQPIDNRTYQPYQGREPYELSGEVTGPKDVEGELFLTDGKNIYLLQFNDKDTRNSGRITPIGEFGFTIDGNAINWFDSTPAHIRFSSRIEKQILEFSGKEDK
jgi:hypothetical protein